MRNILGAVLLLVGVCAQESRTHAETIDDVITEYADLLLLADMCPMLTFNSTDGQFPQFFTAKKFNQKLIGEREPFYDDFKRAEKAVFEERMLSSGRANCQDALSRYGANGDSVRSIIEDSTYNFSAMSDRPMRDIAEAVLNLIVLGEICTDVVFEGGSFEQWLKNNPYVYILGDRDSSYNVLHGSRLKEIYAQRKALSVEANCRDRDQYIRGFSVEISD